MSRQSLSYASPMHPPRRLGWLKSRRFARAAGFAAIIGVSYFGTYATLSRFGRYEVGGFDPRGITWYYWAPAGFSHHYRAREGVYSFFLPAYLIDRELWHTESCAWGSIYPRHDPKNVAELELAWTRSR